ESRDAHLARRLRRAVDQPELAVLQLELRDEEPRRRTRARPTLAGRLRGAASGCGATGRREAQSFRVAEHGERRLADHHPPGLVAPEERGQDPYRNAHVLGAQEVLRAVRGILGDAEVAEAGGEPAAQRDADLVEVHLPAERARGLRRDPVPVALEEGA